ncbi:hypothetical protein AB0I54_10290 [Streptomyces sp. NPDC050625]|uniref:hypothetical protein n=1 Tax=Streptomyces sp. NPDC050625 TaxID=3154629 RepID=UPI003444B594
MDTFRPDPDLLLPDPWDESTGETRPGPGAAAAHDPHEVTVQLDALQGGDVHPSPAENSARGGGDGSEGPVFVDESGRRGRTFRRLGMLVGIACAVYAVVIVATLLSGSSDAPWLPVPGQNEDKPASQVDSPPLPAESAEPSTGDGSAAPGASPAPSDGTTPSTGARTTAPGTGKASAEPATTTAPQPTATKTTSGAGDSGSGSGSGSAGGSAPSTRPETPTAPASSTPSSPVEGSATPTESPASVTSLASSTRLSPEQEHIL